MSAMESFWANKAACDDAERAYYQKLSGCESSVEESTEVEEAAPVQKPAVIKPDAKKAEALKNTSQKSDAKSDSNNWSNKAQCDDAEKAFHERLAQNPGAFRCPANGERTFIMLKPDAVQRGLVGEVMARFESRGFRLLATKFMSASRDLLTAHYSDLSKKAFFPELIRYMASGPVVPMVWEGLQAVRQGRVMLGATNPKDSDPGTIRGDLCIDVGRNIIHGSDSVEAANREIAMWFSPEEISCWRSATVEWVYEDEEIVTDSSLADSSNVDGLVSNISSSEDMALVKKLDALEVENKQLKKVTDDLKALVLSLEARVGQLEGGKTSAAAPAAKAAAPAEEEDDDDVDLFGSDDEEEVSEEKKRITEERLKAYNDKKAKKPKIIAKTSVLFDVKPWDDETDHAKMLEAVKSIEMEGLVWGASKLVPIGYGIKKLQVIAVVVDDLVSVEELSEKMEEFEDYVQSVDVAAMNKI